MLRKNGRAGESLDFVGGPQQAVLQQYFFKHQSKELMSEKLFWARSLDMRTHWLVNGFWPVAYTHSGVMFPAFEWQRLDVRSPGENLLLWFLAWASHFGGFGCLWDGGREMWAGSMQWRRSQKPRQLYLLQGKWMEAAESNHC